MSNYDQVYTKNDLYTMYNIYLNNLKKSPLKKEWVNPLEKFKFIKNSEDKYILNWEDEKNPYLDEYNSEKIKLALDIKQNGIYWHFGGEYQGDKILLNEGKHRFASILLADHCNKWNLNKKFLCVVDPIALNKDYIYKVVEKKLDKPITMKIPYVSKRSIFKRKVYNKFYNKIQKRYNLKDGINEIKVVTDWESVRAYQVWAVFLKDLFYKYKEKYNEIIKPSPIINNQEKWNDFIK
jgi:hypothetical protein